jgi:hypothetical protein
VAYPQARPDDSRALWSLVCGILGILCCAAFAVAAIVLGNNVKREYGDAAPSNAQIGVILGWVGVGLWAVGLIVSLVIVVGSN